MTEWKWCHDYAMEKLKKPDKRDNCMFSKPKEIFLLGLLLSVVLSTATAVPYILAWQSLNFVEGKMNVVNVQGITYAYGEQTSLVNMTLIAFYPRAAVEAYSDMFAVDLFFLVGLDSNVTEFICYDAEVDFRSVNWTYVYYGRKDLDVQSGTLVDFHRADDTGSIAPFLVNVSMNIDSETWPAFNQDISHLLYLTDQIETFPDLTLNGRINIGSNSSGIGVLFDMTKHSTIIYRFNYPPTVWIAYGSSLFIMIVASLNLFFKRRSEAH